MTEQERIISDIIDAALTGKKLYLSVYGRYNVIIASVDSPYLPDIEFLFRYRKDKELSSGVPWPDYVIPPSRAINSVKRNWKKRINP